MLTYFNAFSAAQIRLLVYVLAYGNLVCQDCEWFRKISDYMWTWKYRVIICKGNEPVVMCIFSAVLIFGATISNSRTLMISLLPNNVLKTERNYSSKSYPPRTAQQTPGGDMVESLMTIYSEQWFYEQVNSWRIDHCTRTHFITVLQVSVLEYITE